MSTLYFANHEIIVLRTRQRGSSDRYTLSATFTALPIDIQPVPLELQQYTNGRPGHSFTAFVGTDHLLREGDRIITLNSSGGRDKRYEVKNVSYWAGAGMLDHQELTIVDETP